MLLTANQHAIVQRLLAGENSSDIARETNRSVHTVRTTIRTIYERLGVHALSELASGVKAGAFRIHTVDDHGRERTLRSALKAIRYALLGVREHNKRTGMKRRKCRISLDVDEMTAILSACQPETPSGIEATSE